MLARGALCRLAADVPRTSTHDLPQVARFLQRALLARNASHVPAIRALSRAYASALGSRRSYATATRATKPTATVKKAVKTVAAKKPAAKKRAAPAKKTKKTPKKAVAKKAAPKKRVKKAPTPEQKEKAAIAELRKKALKEPLSNRRLSALIVFIGEQTSGSAGQGGTQTQEVARQRLADAAKKWKTLTPAEHEHYNHLANEKSASRQAEYKAWITSHTPEQIQVANRARALLRKKLVGTEKGKKRAPAHTMKLHDDRHVKKAPSAYIQFSQERHASGDLKGIKSTDAAKLIGNEWKALSAGEKKKYEDLHNAEKAQLARASS